MRRRFIVSTILQILRLLWRRLNSSGYCSARSSSVMRREATTGAGGKKRGGVAYHDQDLEMKKKELVYCVEHSVV